MKRFLAILLATAMILSLLTTTIVFIGAEEEAPKDEVYLSDLTPTYWQMYGGTSNDAATPYTPGYNKHYDHGGPLVMSGVTYEKGLSTHPDGSGAQFVYDLSGYNYTTFSATVGKDDGSAAGLPGGLITFRVYVDGELKAEIVELIAGTTHDFMVDVTGASELKLSIDPGSDNITCDGAIWGNAKLSNAVIETPAEPADELYLSDTTPSFWQMYGGTSNDAATPYTPGYNKHYDHGGPLVMNGVTYDKGLSTHPDGNGAQFVYDLSGYNYTTFSATVGKDDGSAAGLPGGLITFRVYVDGELKAEIVELVAGTTYDFMVDVTGASELKLSIDPGSDNITCDGAIWGNAKLSNDPLPTPDPDPDPDPMPADKVYLSDTTPTSWKIFGGTSADANPPHTPGYNVYFEDNTPLMLGGVAYDKGLSTHPDFTFDAEFVYDISGYAFTTFTALVGKTDRYVAALPDSYTTFRVYVDGVLKDEVVDLKAGDTYFFIVDVTGGSELKLVTAGGSDNVTCEGVVWADAMLNMGVDECEEHRWSDGRVQKEASCTEDGEMLYRCSTCGKERVESIKGEHRPGTWEIDEEATCLDAGTKMQKCLDCGETLDSAVLEAKGHTPGKWSPTKAPTCTEVGKKMQPCDLCGAVLDEKEISALGHAFGEWGVLDGQDVRVCDCGEQETRARSKEDGCASMLSVGAMTMLVMMTGGAALLLNKKKRYTK